MNEHEKYLFDLRGYIVVRNAITTTQIDDLSTQLEMNRTEKSYILGSDRTRLNVNEDLAWTASSLLDWGGCYIDLLDLPTIRPYLETLLGRNYRLDHDYIKIDNAKHSYELYLHGGGQGAGGASDLVGPTDGGQCYYRFSNGRFFNGLVAVAFELDTVLPGQGGFACIPGSHKVNFELPSDWNAAVPKKKSLNASTGSLRRQETPSSLQRPVLTAPYRGVEKVSAALSSTSTARTQSHGVPVTTTRIIIQVSRRARRHY